MGIHPNEISTDALLEQAGWLTALARRLVRDPAEADDVAQETMLAALSSGEPAPRRWLAHVARNIARARARSRSARAHRESARGALPPAPSSSDLAEKLEAQRLLVEAVRELDEPYRTAILLHYWEHKTSEEIAAIQGVAAGTVRWRLKQAVDALRERLDARHGGDRRAWSALLVPLFKSTSAGTIATASILTGVIAMKLQAVVAVAVLIAAGVGLWAMKATPSIGTTAPVSATPAVERLEKPKEPALDPDADEQQGSGRSRASIAGGSQHAVSQASTHIEARIIDDVGAPLPGARLTISHSDQGEFGPSDTSGHLLADVAFQNDASSETFVFDAPGRAAHSITANQERGHTVYLGDIVLQPGSSVSGRMVDEEGRPVSGATVGMEHQSPSSTDIFAREFMRGPVSIDEPRARTGKDGTFRIEGVPIGHRQLIATKSSGSFEAPASRAYSGVFEVRPGIESTGIEITLHSLPPVIVIKGIVLDPEGAPVREANVWSGTKFGSGSVTGTMSVDKNGRFKLTISSGSEVELYARDGKERWVDTAHTLLRGAETEVTLRFVDARRFVLVTVTDEDRKPIERWSAACRVPDHDDVLATVHEEAHDNGIARLGLPSSTFVLFVEAPGYARIQQGPVDPSVIGDTLAIVLHRQPGIIGRVVGVGGPVAGARMRLFREADGSFVQDGFTTAVDPTAKAETLTATDGTFRFDSLDSGLFVVRAEKEGSAPAESSILSFDVDRGVRGLELRLTDGGRIEGRVIKPAGTDPAGTVVSISRGDAFPVTQRVGPDGEFAFEHLMPGSWMVMTREKEMRPGDHHSIVTNAASLRPKLTSNCEVFEGRTTHFDVDMSDSGNACILLGTFSVRGSPGIALNATFADGDPNGAPPVRLDESGAFRLASKIPGKARILVTALGGDLGGTELLVPVDLKIGTTHWEAAMDQATLALHGSGTRASPREHLVLVVANKDGSSFVRPLLAEGDNECEVPAGRGRILWLDEIAEHDPDPREWSGGKDVTIAPRTRVEVDRP